MIRSLEKKEAAEMTKPYCYDLSDSLVKEIGLKSTGNEKTFVVDRNHTHLMFNSDLKIVIVKPRYETQMEKDLILKWENEKLISNKRDYLGDC